MQSIIVTHGGTDSAGDVLKQGTKFGYANDLLELGEELGSGAAAKVYVCRRLNTGEELAVKVINLGKLRLMNDFEGHLVKMNREVQILQGLSNPRIVNLHAVHRTKQWVFLVMELVKGGELFDVIVSNKTLNEVEAKYIFRQLLEGVGYMHSKNVIHRDLKPENILISSSRELPPPLSGTLREVKIADFGLSKIINEGSSFAKTFVGTPQYWAPEVKMNREVQILQGLSNPRIVNLHAVHRTKQWVFLVMELVKGGELFDVIVSNKTLNEVEAKYIFRQLLEGVGYMHSKNVIHRDLKPENILISSSRELPPPLSGTLREVKIADFGLSKIINEGSSFAKTFVGTPQYWAPEVLNVQRGGGSYTQAADYWSLGAVLFVMLGGRYPFDGKAMPLEEQIRTASYSMTSAAWQRVSEEAKDMVRGLLKVNPAERLKLEDCMVHPWLAGGVPAVPASPQVPTTDVKAVVTEVSSGKPTSTSPVVEHPSHSDISGRSESGGSRQKMEATKSGGSNTKASGSEESPQDQGQNKQVPIVLAGNECEKDEEQDLIFCLNELLKLQVSIASSLEVACLAFRHADRDLSDNIRRAFNEANKLSSKAATVVSNYAQVAQQVSRNILPDLKLAIQEKEPNLAVSLLGIVKDWVANMKKDGEQIQHLYSDLQQNVHDLILGAQRAKSGADRRLAESLQEQVADFGGHHQVLALPEGGQVQQRPQATSAEGIHLEKTPSNVVPGGSSVPEALKPQTPNEQKRGEESNCAVSVPLSMNMWTRHLFDHLTAVEDSAKRAGEGRSDYLMLQSGANDSTPTADNYEAWKLDVLDLLFMAPGVGRSTLPKPEPLQHQALPRVESSQGTEADGSMSTERRRIDSSVEDADVPMEEAEEEAIVQYHPSAPMNEDAFVNQTSGSLLRALRELKRVDEILQGCSAFWSNMDGTVQKLAQMKEHTECLVNFANSSKPLRERFEQRLGEYTSFWTSLERLCRQYCMDHQAFSKQMHAMMREVSDAADFLDTAQSARLGVAMGYREKQLRQGGGFNLE